MKRIAFVVFACAVAVASSAAEGLAQWDPRMAEGNAVVDTNGVKWIDGKFLPIEGRWTGGDMKEYYCRLPDTLTTNVNSGVRGQRFNTAGMQFRFKTDSDFLVIRYASRSHGYDGTANQAGVNVHGWDVYRLDPGSGKWLFSNTSHGSSKVSGDDKSRVKRIWWGRGDACVINLPAYDGIESFAVGIDPKAKIEALPLRKSGVNKPVVFYGTSITHGASASRPGLGFVNQVGRNLDVPVCNLGFSGSGVMEYELADVIAKIDASCYVLDCLWNMHYSADAMRNGFIPCGVCHNYEPFIRRLRALRPGVPIVMAEQCDVFMHKPIDKEMFIRKLYDQLILEGWENLVYLPKTKMYSGDFEGTIDTCHPNDLGMVSMAAAYGEAVAAALKLPGGTELAMAEAGAHLVLKRPGLVVKPCFHSDGWAHCGSSVGGLKAEDGSYPFKLELKDGRVVNGSAVFADTTDGKVSARWTMAVSAPVEFDALYLDVSVPVEIQDGFYVINGKADRFPKLGEKFQFGACGNARTFELRDRAGRRVCLFEFERPVSMLIQDSSKWRSGFGIRFMCASRKFVPGALYSFALKASGAGVTKFAVSEPYVMKAGSEWRPFTVKPGVKEGSAIDFTKVCGLDAPAGKYGKVVVRNGHFEFENRPGVVQRFYGVNLCGLANYPKTMEIAEAFATQLARRGYNSVRVHHFDNPLVTGSKDRVTPNPDYMRRLDMLAAACYRHGIYLTSDLFVSREIPWRKIGVDRDGSSRFSYKMEVKTNELAFADLCDFTRNWLTHVNEFTGRRWADEPGFPFLSFVNEGCADTCIRGMKDADRPRYAAEQERFIERLTKFLREEIGSKQLLTDLNGCSAHKMWRKSRSMLDYVDAHFYVDHPEFLDKSWQLPSRCRNVIPFLDDGKPQGAPWCGNYFVEGKPCCITEWNFSGPGNYRGIGGIATGAWSALKNWDGLWRFAWSHSDQGVSAPCGQKCGYFDLSGDPLSIASDRATLCLFIRGDIRPGETNAFVISKKDGRMLLNTKCTSGGFVEKGAFDAGVLKADVGSVRATVWASSVDGNPLRGSKRILVTHLTDVQNTGCKFQDDSMKVLLEWGSLPHLMRRGRAKVSMALDPGEFELYELDSDGSRRGKVPFSFDGGELSFIADTALHDGEASYLYEIVRK